jgi:superfamily II DNA helicase RecQ
MQKKDVFVNMPTGSGKSLIFHIALLAEMWMYSHAPNTKIWTKEPITIIIIIIIIIISPLIALMKDQVKHLNDVKYIQYIYYNIAYSN